MSASLLRSRNVVGSAPEFRIRAIADRSSTSPLFRAGDTGHTSLAHFVNGEAARSLYRELRDSSAWGLTICDGRRVRGLPPERYETCSSKECIGYMTDAYAAGHAGFAYIREEFWPLSASSADAVSECDRALEIGPALTAFTSFARGADFKRFVCEVVGARSVVLLRLGIECYRPGQFFGFTKGAPDDAKFGFVWDLTPTWITEWGGSLEFCDFSGAHVHSYVPRFNFITLYGLWKSRGISVVAPFAPRGRYCVVGYLGGE